MKSIISYFKYEVMSFMMLFSDAAWSPWARSPQVSSNDFAHYFFIVTDHVLNALIAVNRLVAFVGTIARLCYAVSLCLFFSISSKMWLQLKIQHLEIFLLQIEIPEWYADQLNSVPRPKSPAPSLTSELPQNLEIVNGNTLAYFENEDTQQFLDLLARLANSQKGGSNAPAELPEIRAARGLFRSEVISKYLTNACLIACVSCNAT